MRRDGEVLMAKAATIFQGGSQRFFFKGNNERWRGIVSDEDLARYDTKLEAMVSGPCAKWLEKGRSCCRRPTGGRRLKDIALSC